MLQGSHLTAADRSSLSKTMKRRKVMPSYHLCLNNWTALEACKRFLKNIYIYSGRKILNMNIYMMFTETSHMQNREGGRLAKSKPHMMSATLSLPCTRKVSSRLSGRPRSSRQKLPCICFERSITLYPTKCAEKSRR